MDRLHSPRVDDKNQLFVISPSGGEALQITKSETSVSGFVWAPDSRSVAYSAAEALTQEQKDRKERLGDYEVVRREYQHVHLWTIGLDEAMKAPAAGRQRTRGKDFSVGSFSWSPDGHAIAFSATLNPDLIQRQTSDIYRWLCRRSRQQDRLEARPRHEPQWSPDGRQIVFSSAMGRELSFAMNSRLAVVPADGGTPRSITDSFDENPWVRRVAARRRAVFSARRKPHRICSAWIRPPAGSRASAAGRAHGRRLLDQR